MDAMDLKDVFKLYPEDGYGNSGVPDEAGIQRLVELLEEWVKQFKKARDDYGNLPADDANNIVGYARSQRLLEEAQRMAEETRTFSAVQKAAGQMQQDIPVTAEKYKSFVKKYDAFVSPAQPDGTAADKVPLPKERPLFSAPPSRADIVSMKYDLDNHIMPPAPKQTQADDRRPKVKDVVNPVDDVLTHDKDGDKQATKADIDKAYRKVGKHVADALTHDKDGDKQAAKADIDEAYRKLAKNAYNAAVSQDDKRYEKTDGKATRDINQDRETFVEAFMESHKDSIASLHRKVDSSNPASHASLEHDLANIAVMAANPLAFTQGVSTALKGSVVTDTDIKSAAQSLSTAITSVDSTRLSVEHMAGMNGQDFHTAQAAGSAAASKVARGEKDEKTVLAESKDKYPAKEDDTDLGRQKKAAGYIVLADTIEDSGRPVSMAALKDTSHPEHKASAPQFFNFNAARSDIQRSMLTDPKMLRMSEADTTAYVEKEAEKRLNNASQAQMQKSEAALAKAFGPEAEAAMQGAIQAERPQELSGGQTIAESEKRLEYARETYALAKAMNTDPAMKDIALDAMKNAPKGENPAKYALAQVKEAQKIKAAIDKNHDGKIDKNEAADAIKNRADLPPEIRAATDSIFEKILKAHGADIPLTLRGAKVNDVVQATIASDYTGKLFEGQTMPTTAPAAAPSTESRNH